MNKETLIVAAVACLLGVGIASLFMPKAQIMPQNAAFMISSSEHFAAPAGPSALEVMQKNAKASLADFASTDAAVKLAILAERNQSAADAAILSSASACITERAGIELPKFQQTMMSDGVTMMVKTALAGGKPPVGGKDINAKAGAYMQEHATEVMEQMQNATMKQLAAGQTLMTEMASDPKLVMSCTAERAVQALAQG
ncbi:MAG: hypothetical protein WCC66_00415 [Rhizobiaceae bacterium]